MAKETPKIAFGSPEELGDLLRVVEQRLHNLNRVALGESKYAWQLADLIGAAGQLALYLKDKPTRAEFGDGWTPGTVQDTAQGARIRESLAAKMRD